MGIVSELPPHIHRRGFTLIQMLGFLTILGTVLTLGTMLIAQMVRFNAREQARYQAEAKVHNVVGHFFRDVGGAERLAEATDASADRLVLYEKEGVVVYEWSAPRLTRTWQPIDGAAVTYAWEWETLAPEFLVEKIGGGAAVVWLKFSTSRWDADTRLSPTGYSAAARLGGASG